MQTSKNYFVELCTGFNSATNYGGTLFSALRYSGFKGW